MAKLKSLSLVSKGIRYKLRIAFYLMSVLPLLICISIIVKYIALRMGFRLEAYLYTLVIISIFFAVAGYFLIKRIIDRILCVSIDAKLIVAGDIHRNISLGGDDEIGELSKSLNDLTQRIRNNIDQLRDYGAKNAEVGIDMQRRVFVLYSLLQISSLISQGAKLEDILKLATEKSRLLADSDIAYLLLKEEGQDEFQVKIVDGINSGYLSGIKVQPEEAVFAKLNQENRPFVLDDKNILPKNLYADFYDKFRLKNTLVMPVYSKGRFIGMLGIGNNKEAFSYKQDDVELVDILAKQIAIAVENDTLIHRIEKLEIKDPLTGLYNATYIRSRLQEEIKRAIICRRPCAFILLNIDDFQKFNRNFGLPEAEGALKNIASLIISSVTEVDRVGRFGDNEFAVILPEKNKRQAQDIAENIRKGIELLFAKEQDSHRMLTVSGSVSENPLDGIEAEELILKAKEGLVFAKKQGKNRIVGYF